MQTQQSSEQQHYIHTLLVTLGTVGKEVFTGEVDAVTMKVVRLKKPRPELLLRHFVRNVLIMLLPYYIQKTRFPLR